MEEKIKKNRTEGKNTNSAPAEKISTDKASVQKTSADKAGKKVPSKKSKKSISEHLETRLLVEHAFQMARSLGVGKVLVYADVLRDRNLVAKYRNDETVIWLTHTREEDLAMTRQKKDIRIELPKTPLTRKQQVSIGLFLSVLNGFTRLDESVLCLAGVVGSKRLDNLLIANPRRDYPWLEKRPLKELRGLIATKEFVRLIQIALRFANEGREGKPIGTILVLGKAEELEPYISELILNPCKGHPRKQRNIHNQEFFETLRELSGLDGAFIVNTGGVVEYAGVYLNATMKKPLRSGLGARHRAAAAITWQTSSVAIAVSQSSSNVTVFHAGEPIFELETSALS